ncbi:sterile alpha motif domain-containing 15 [Labeo rohita]|uniref:Sterile alpha motif domain-containing protein 15 n=2 Tax=Labeo rohita TaxID=84645 RepID=A0ABQ8LNX5_LABRO|nr:sterile alpha motif domain-containing protein 15 [Labeo rohita]XP_050994699.1 sterile alpha motif domain-containing protein 15 [Labeo rohita]XP_050994700.1 sterile alpha motif domain-containing protein 15 [Labeo rohita]KAI2652373.1 Sterile alpha motif domain-containing protein 15 [Labeo rohita]RXN34898.1 sterile alpha motif domain-containing 15 [Labeo rohita]
MEFLRWSSEDVARWIESIGFPQYQACFTQNYITGRKLIHVNCFNLPRLGITDLQHMKLISAQVRELLGVSEPHWDRSIADPLHDDRTVFLQTKSKSGRQADSLTYEHFLNNKSR